MKLYNSTKRNIKKSLVFIGALLLSLSLAWLFQIFAYAKFRTIEGVDIVSVMIPSFETGITMILIVITAFIIWFFREQEYTSSAWRYWIEDLDIEGIEQTIIMLEKNKRRLEIEREKQRLI
jgi:hypothetical protein